jgi:hypothetical protein
MVVRYCMCNHFNGSQNEAGVSMVDEGYDSISPTKAK